MLVMYTPPTYQIHRQLYSHYQGTLLKLVNLLLSDKTYYRSIDPTIWQTDQLSLIAIVSQQFAQMTRYCLDSGCSSTNEFIHTIIAQSIYFTPLMNYQNLIKSNKLDLRVLDKIILPLKGY